MRKFLLVLATLVFSIILISGSHPSIAQGPTATPSKDCKPADLIASLKDLKSSGDAAKDMAALLKIQDQISDQSVACSGLTFSGTGSKVIGPFDLAKGAYRFKVVKGLEFFTAELKGIPDDLCVLGMVSSQKAEDQASSEGCRVTLAVDTMGSSGDWEFTLEPLK